ncbi:hypothetical protein Tco_0319069 [Tanacetum coccineum]
MHLFKYQDQRAYLPAVNTRLESLIFCPCKSKAASVPAGSRNSSASVTAGGSDPAASRNRPAVNYAGRPNPTRRVGHAAHRAAAQSNPLGVIPSTDNDIGQGEALSKLEELISGKYLRIGHLKPFGVKKTSLNTSDAIRENMRVKLISYLDGYTRFKTDKPAGPSSAMVLVLWKRNADYAEDLLSFNDKI